MPLMTPQEWNSALAPGIGWKKAAAVIEAEARKLLLRLPEGKVLNTAQLVEALYPAVSARGPEIDCRQRIVRALLRSGPSMILLDCRVRDEINFKRMYGHISKPWLWHRPTPKLCPHCGGSL